MPSAATGFILIACFATSVERHGYAEQLQHETAAQATPAPASTPSSPTSTEQVGGILRGTVKSGTTPLPGVRITATNTLTGKKYSAATDANGNYNMTIPQNGRYVVRVEFTVFAAVTKEALINATSRDQQVDFSLILASRIEQQEKAEQSRSCDHWKQGAEPQFGWLSGRFDYGSSGRRERCERNCRPLQATMISLANPWR